MVYYSLEQNTSIDWKMEYFNEKRYYKISRSQDYWELENDKRYYKTLPGAGWKRHQEAIRTGGTPGRRCNRLENVDDDENSNGNEEDGDDGGDHLVWESHCP